jgi:hypothetical protein
MVMRRRDAAVCGRGKKVEVPVLVQVDENGAVRPVRVGVRDTPGTGFVDEISAVVDIEDIGDGENAYRPLILDEEVQPAVPVDVHPGNAMPAEIPVAPDIELSADFGEVDLAERKRGRADESQQEDAGPGWGKTKTFPERHGQFLPWVLPVSPRVCQQPNRLSRRVRPFDRRRASHMIGRTGQA